MADMSFLKDFKKKVEKMEAVTTDFSPPTYWYHTGNYALNKILSGSYTKGVPQSRITILAGPSGSGKSFLSANIIREAQAEGAFIVVLDSENAMDKTFLRRLGVDTSDEALFYAGVVTIQDVTKVMSEFITGYEATYGKDNKEAQKVLVVIDSLDMLLTDSENEKFEKGDQTGDQGQRAKLMKHLMRTLVTRISRLNITVLATHQVYANQDIKNGQGVWMVNNAIKYCASQIALITNVKLRDADREVLGVEMRVEAYKSRFSKLGSKVAFEVPYVGGMDPLGGLLGSDKDPGLLQDDGIVTREGRSFICKLPNEELKFMEKNFDEAVWQNILDSHPTILEAERILAEDLA